MSNDIVSAESMQLEAQMFTFPAGVLKDEDSELSRDLRQLYQLLVLSMERDAYDVRLDTVQKMRLERTALNYIKLRELEATSGFNTPAQQKDYTLFLMALMESHEKSLRQTRQDQRAEQEERFQKAVVASIDKLQIDAKMKNSLLREIAQNLEIEG